MTRFSQISPEEMAAYRATAQRRQQRERQEQACRREQAWALARQAAALLKKQFGASRVMLFGSLARGDCFDAHSDVDLMAWGLNEREHYFAVSKLLELDPAIAVDLILAEHAPPALLAAVEQEGIPL